MYHRADVKSGKRGETDRNRGKGGGEKEDTVRETESRRNTTRKHKNEC